ncbi:uncharacterized protein HaLaN_21734, partial [Haematococcus lacustris]
EAIAAQRQLEAAWEVELAVQQSGGELVGATTLEGAEQLLAMYVNRGNAGWAAGQRWSHPSLWDARKQEEWMASEDWNLWKGRMAQGVRTGSFAVQLIAVDSQLNMAEAGQSVDLWTSDPWDLLHLHRPAAAVEALGGREGLTAFTLLLHLTEQQLRPTLDMLRAHNYCGFTPRNIIFFQQALKPGYAYNAGQQRFIRGPASSPSSSGGSGLSLLALNWVAEGQQLDLNGCLRPLPGTALELMAIRGVQWMVSHHTADLGLLSRESCLDLVQLPFCLAAHKAASCSAFTQVVKEEGLGPAARRQGSVVLSFAPDRHRAARGLLAALPASHPAQGLWPVAELRVAELHAGSMKDVVRGGKSSSGHYLVGLDRYVLHLDALR